MDQMREKLRAVRERYDGLKRGDTAAHRRCRTEREVTLLETYWRVGEAFAHEQAHLGHVVLLFPLARQAQVSGRPFSFGRFLRRRLGDSDGATLRFRRLLRSNNRDELDRRLRSILRLTCADGAGVDWGVLGLDILWFFAASDNVRRRWAQDFYAPISRIDASGTTLTVSNR